MAYHEVFFLLVFRDVLPPPERSLDPGLCLCSGLLIKLFQAAHMRTKSTFPCGPQELSAFAKIFQRLALFRKKNNINLSYTVEEMNIEIANK